MGRYFRRLSSATAVLFILVVAFPQRVKSFSSIFELQLVSLDIDLSGGCCSGQSPGPDGRCTGSCPVFLHFCMKPYQNIIDMTSPCFLFEFQTPILNQTRTGVYDVRTQGKMSIGIPYTWPGKFSLIVGAWHPSEGTGRTLVSEFVIRRDLEVSQNWTNERTVSLFPNSTKHRSLSVLDLRYRIICKEFYHGKTCEKLCRPRNDQLGHYTCNEDGDKVCMHGWKNSMFSTNGSSFRDANTNTTMDLYCLTAICENECVHGKCNEPNQCICAPGWTGNFCDTCLPYPNCKHGRCQAEYQCICDEGWGGQLCDKDLNYCTNHKPCKHGGTCTNTGQGSFTCSCSESYMGETCDILKNPCNENPCENGATCKNPSDGVYTCHCPPDYFGHQCETWANICKENNCINGGTCIHDPNGFICSCPPGYTGVFCEELDFSNCLVHPCFNGGTCSSSSSGVKCHCPPGISGIRCETAHTCFPDTCRNGGSCVRNHGNITCQCPSGYSGILCEINHNQCSSNPCANGATCTNLLDGQFYCDCAPGFMGRLCKEPNHCLTSTCSNGATCHSTVNGYICMCRVGYRGERCHLLDTVPLVIADKPSASNVSHRISEKEQDSGSEDTILTICLGVLLPVVVIITGCFVWCILAKTRRKRRHACVEEEANCAKVKNIIDEETLQNERNAKQMSYKQKCDMPQKIVNDLDRVKPPKVLNNQVNNTNPSLHHQRRTFNNKIDNVCGASVSQSAPDFSRQSKGVYVIEDHLKSCAEIQPDFPKDILATEV